MDATPAAPKGPCDAGRGVRQFLFLAFLFLSAVVASLLVLRAAPAPLFWLWVIWAAALFASILFVRGSWPRAILLNLVIVACMVAVAKARLVPREYTPVVFPDGVFFVSDDVLGWAPAKGIKAHAVKYGPAGLFHGPQGVLYASTYTIDSNGLRVAPPYRQDDLAGTVLFFGCSFTFGEDLRDSETVPYQVGVQSAGRYRTFNFGVQGYGPNQMLAAIEHGMVRRVVDTTPQYAFYIAIPDHVWRVAGRLPWGWRAPRYALDADGTVHQAGDFEDREPLFERLGLMRHCKCGQCADCESGKPLFERLGHLSRAAIWRTATDSRINDDDIRLYFALVRRSQQLLSAQYPGLQFHVILWPNEPGRTQRKAYEEIRDGFRQMGASLHLVEDILPGYNIDRSPYIISASDPHPSALADRLIAKYIVERVLP